MGAVEAGITARLSELSKRAQVRGTCVYTRFLDPAQQREAAIVASKNGVDLSLYGGYEGAERCLASFYHGDGDERPDFSERISCVLVEWSRFNKAPEHRDLLGASLAIIQDRSFLGDVVIRPGCAYIFLTRELAGHLETSLISVGRVCVNCSQYSGVVEAGEQDARYIRDTVCSFRLDVCVASAFGLSRAAAQEAIVGGRVKLDHIPEVRQDASVSEGGLISIRGMGRAELYQTTGQNRKGRFGVIWSRTPGGKY